MLRNRSRAVAKQSPIMADHQPSSLSSSTAQNPTRSISSFLASPRFFNGFLLPKNLLEAQSSPTSILDANKLFSNFSGNPFGFSKNPVKPTKIFEGNKHPSEKFDSEGIALALALIQEQPGCNKVLFKSNEVSSKVMFKSKLKIQIPSMNSSPNGSPETGGDFGIKTRNSQLTPTGFGSPRVETGRLSLSEMELSEEYTRVVSHGPNPKTTHIYDNCVVERCCGVVIGSSPRLKGRIPESPCEGFLSFCETCKKNLGDGSDIFMYRGEKGFCSEECRCQEMILDGLMS